MQSGIRHAFGISRICMISRMGRISTIDCVGRIYMLSLSISSASRNIRVSRSRRIHNIGRVRGIGRVSRISRIACVFRIDRSDRLGAGLAIIADSHELQNMCQINMICSICAILV